MRRSSLVLLAAGAIAAVAGAGALITRQPAPRADITLTSASIVLPDDVAMLPPGPHADIVTARCTACHSADMMLNQPPLSADQWKATVTKMREAYHADIPDADTPAIVAYLGGLSAAKGTRGS